MSLFFNQSRFTHLRMDDPALAQSTNRNQILDYFADRGEARAGAQYHICGASDPKEVVVTRLPFHLKTLTRAAKPRIRRGLQHCGRDPADIKETIVFARRFESTLSQASVERRTVAVCGTLPNTRIGFGIAWVPLRASLDHPRRSSLINTLGVHQADTKRSPGFRQHFQTFECRHPAGDRSLRARVSGSQSGHRF
jgi:hypothetical protein